MLSDLNVQQVSGIKVCLMQNELLFLWLNFLHLSCSGGVIIVKTFIERYSA